MTKPKAILYYPVALFLKFFSFLKGHRITKKVKIKGPAITLSNHTSFYDFLYTMSALFPRRPNFIAAKKFFYEKPLGPILRRAHAIPKALLEPDLTATRMSLKTLKNNGILALFPEGQITLSGEFLTPAFSIAKLIKKAAVPLYVIKHYNAYLVNPPWNKVTYKGRINTEMSLLLAPEQIKALSEQDIYDKVYDALHHNPFVYNKEAKYTYKQAPLTDIDLILYECPACKGETLTYKHNDIYCTSCSYRRTRDAYWQFGDTNFYELYLSQEATMAHKIKTDPMYAISAYVTVEGFRDKQITTVGHGTFSINHEGYTFSGEIDGEPALRTFKIEHVASLPSDTGINVQIYENGELYQFVFSDPFLPVKFRMYSEIIYRLNIN